MDLSEKDKFGLEKSGDHFNYQASGFSAEWQFGNQPIGMVPADPSIADCQGNQMGSSLCPSVSMVDSFSPSLWNHPNNSQSLGFSETNVQNNASSSNSVPIRKPVPMPSRLDMGVLLPTGSGVLPPSLSHFTNDSAFTERAARFACFNGSNFSGMVNPFGTCESLSPYSNASKGAPGAQIQKSEMNRANALKDVSMPIDLVSNSESTMKDQRDKGSLHGGGVSNNDSGEPEFSGSGQEETPNFGTAAGGSSSKGLGAKKRKRTSQDLELEQVEGTQQLSVEATKESVDTKQKGEQNSSTMATMKPSGKLPKDSSEAPMDDYIHVRARRGQATNSHSLAERVRREKISERMKFLQDLVPGCSKVTGKAVMLDEIINYVQSLQRQVEFLSMKLAAVNPRLDCNIEGLLSKEFLQPRSGSSSTMGFSHDMIHPQLHLPQQGLIPAGISGITYSSDALRRAINAQLTMMNGYKEPTPQMPNAWDDELHNVIQMNFDTTNPPLNTQELSGKPRDGFPI